MCGRFANAAPIDIVASIFNIDEILADAKPSYNIAPSQPVLSVVEQEGKRRLVTFKWGLVPFWAKDPAIGNRLINARAETVLEKPAFRHALRSQRCLVVASGFYEWRKVEKGKVPYYLTVPGRPCFGFAGLYEKWKTPEGEELDTCTIITTEANEAVMPVHNRMPVILHESDESMWLDPDRPPGEVLPLLQPYPAKEMTLYPVSKLVNTFQYDSPECIRPV